MILIFSNRTEAEDCLIAFHKSMRPWAQLRKTGPQEWTVICDC